MKEEITIALAGNPNSGKSTIFNNLTGSHQHIGNYPGVTVEKVEGKIEYDNYILRFVDLPGTYSLTPYSAEEIVARDFILYEKPDLIVNIIDSSNLERNLYLTTQLLELNVPLILVLNMIDITKKRGIKIDKEKLSSLLQTPVVTTIGSKNIGTDSILQTIIKFHKEKNKYKKVKVKYNRDISNKIEQLIPLIKNNNKINKKYPTRWLAIKLLENDIDIIKKLKSDIGESAHIFKLAEKLRSDLQKEFNDEPDIIIAESRYGFISGIGIKTVHSTIEARHTLSDKIDMVLTNKFVGFPIFLFMMWALFQVTFTVADPFVNFLQYIMNNISNFFIEHISNDIIKSLLVDGIIGGVGAVLTFLPNIMILFFSIALLEGSGYMPRAAFIVDKIMSKFGLNGKSFIPMLLGFGCSVPAIMATRTIDNKTNRLITMLTIPLMSCSARLPVYVLFAGTFFKESQRGNVIFSLYLIGIILALLVAKVLKSYLFKEEETPFIMELPIYRMPTLRSLLMHMWLQSYMYIKKAGTVILGFSIFMWFLANYPVDQKLITKYEMKIAKITNKQEIGKLKNELKSELLEKSFAGQIGKTLVPILKPIGLGNWKFGTALVVAVGAKELVVSTLSTLYRTSYNDEESTSLQENIKKEGFLNPLRAYVIMLFVLISIPCVATLAILKKETNSWKWPIFLAGYTLSLAWIASFIVYNIGKILGFGS